MNRYLLLILLSSWSLLVTESCDTGVAFVNSVLSVGRSSLANADVALLETYTAETVEKCMEDCCAGKYGACSIASYKKNTTKKNCLHFNCRPLKQCKFVSSSSTDSFTFSSNPHALHPVPSSHNLTTTSTTPSPTTTTTKAKIRIEQPQAVEEIATFSEEQEDLKNDNTSVKPRKGVDDLNPDIIQSKPGVKPRKGVTLDDVPHSKFLQKGLSKSNVKPRKGVGNYSSSEVFTEENFLLTNITQINETSVSLGDSNNESTKELVSELAVLFQDDSIIESSTMSHPVTSSNVYTISPTSVSNIYATSSSVDHAVTSDKFSTSTEQLLKSSSSFLVQSSFSSTPYLSSSQSYVSTTTIPTSIVSAEQSSSMMPIASTLPSLSARAHLSMDEPKSLDKAMVSDDSEESENSKKYTSSMHLVLSLVFGLLVLFGVLGVVAKRMYDSWQRRDYYRMNYLIDGIYNGYE